MSLCPRSDLNRRVLNDVQESLRLIRQTIDLIEKRIDHLNVRLEHLEQQESTPVLASWSTLPSRIEELEAIVEQSTNDHRRITELSQRVEQIQSQLERKPSQSSRKAAAAAAIGGGNAVDGSTAKVESSEG